MQRLLDWKDTFRSRPLSSPYLKSLTLLKDRAPYETSSRAVQNTTDKPTSERASKMAAPCRS